jgi:hypothetical protein
VSLNRGALNVRTFSFLIHDTRSKVPTLEFATTTDEAGARRLAGRRLAASTHHVAIEVIEGERLLFWCEREGAVLPAKVSSSR